MKIGYYTICYLTFIPTKFRNIKQ